MEQYSTCGYYFFIQLFLSPLNILFNFFSLFSQIQPMFSLSFFFRLDSLTLLYPHRSLIDQAAAIAIANLKLADLKLHHPPQLSLPMVGWVWSLIDLLGWGFVEDFEFFFFFLGWGFWIWNLLDPVIVVVVCGGGCCCGSGCSGGCWFLVGGTCH